MLPNLFPDMFPDQFPSPRHPNLVPAPESPARGFEPRIFALPSIACSEGSRCSEHISALKDLRSKRISVFYAHFVEFEGEQTEGYIYMLWFVSVLAQLEVVLRGGVWGHFGSGN